MASNFSTFDQAEQIAVICQQPRTLSEQNNISVISATDFPPVLADLLHIDQIFFQHELSSILEMTDKYEVRDKFGRRLFSAADDESVICCDRFCWGNNKISGNRSFQTVILDKFGNEAIILNRLLTCKNTCSLCCFLKMEVSAPPGNVIGFIEQVSSGKYPTFDVTNTSGETLLKIRGPFCLLACLPWCYCCYGEIAYKIYDGVDEDDLVGKISNLGIGFLPGGNKQGDIYSIECNMDSDDSLFFDNGGNHF